MDIIAIIIICSLFSISCFALLGSTRKNGSSSTMDVDVEGGSIHRIIVGIGNMATLTVSTPKGEAVRQIPSGSLTIKVTEGAKLHLEHDGDCTLTRAEESDVEEVF